MASWSSSSGPTPTRSRESDNAATLNRAERGFRLARPCRRADPAKCRGGGAERSARGTPVAGVPLDETEAEMAVRGEQRQMQAPGFGARRVALVARPCEIATYPSDARPHRREPRRVAFFAVALDIGSRLLRGPLRLVERTAVE